MPEKKPNVIRREVEKRLADRGLLRQRLPPALSQVPADGSSLRNHAKQQSFRLPPRAVQTLKAANQGQLTRAQAERALVEFKAAFPDILVHLDKLPAMVRARIPPRPRMTDFVNHKVGGSRRRGRNASNAYFSALMLWEDRYGA